MDIRPLKPEDYKEARKLIAAKLPWIEMPPMESLIGKFEADGRLVGVIGLQNVPAVECIVGESSIDVRDLIVALDQRIANLPRYFCFVSEKNRNFAEMIEKHFGDVTEGFPGKLFVRTRK